MRSIALGFMYAHGLTLPLELGVALRAAGFFPGPGQGPATVNGFLLRYDESRPGWEHEVWGLVCGRILEQAGLPHGPAHRAELTSSFEELNGPPLSSASP